ncbi:hypothetical protein CTI12_AA363310 [Artemisia annua]|uniref:Uncharacterized protein n=1 Tax=Artemisia annua TaxID=35608 RepID=A0A2U1MMB7_ARTAN|nr:hypothetical protein CTI12_AA363310 [Artemisia annua]
MDNLVTLLELAYSAGSPFISDVMRLGFQREVQEERGWLSFLHGWCVCVADRLVYLNAIIEELEYCSNNMFAAQLLVALKSGDDVVFADAIMYFKAIRDFEAQKLENLQLLLTASEMQLTRRMQFVARFDVM